MSQIDTKRVAAASRSYPKPATFSPSYGTAGFRDNASLLASTVFRCGLLTAARSILQQQHCGMMITASHNPVDDNGVKLVEPGGEMLPQTWEALATELAQSTDDEHIAKIVSDVAGGLAVVGGEKCAGDARSETPLTVLVGYDTRPSAAELVAAACAGIEAMGLKVNNCGLVTTPQLHFSVHARNGGSDGEASFLPKYFDTLVGGYEKLVEGKPPLQGNAPLHVDCANGVGAQLMKDCKERLAAAHLPMVLHNTGEGRLNHLSGADFVQKDKVLPSGFDGLPADARCCSLDGDADRLVYFSRNPGCNDGVGVSLMDGDKVAALAALFIGDVLSGDLPVALKKDIKTAYANGASTAYITNELKMQVACTSTGVKFLHEAAHRLFDVGIYFEANGHGTVLFSKTVLEQLQKASASSSSASELLLLSQAINQTVGDGLSGILMVEAILRRKQWTVQEWASLYTDLPSRMTKLQVANRNAITTTDAERKCLEPRGMQDAIDKAVSDFPPGSRAFARPSGTEDAVRVYAEAPTQEQADALADAVGRVVYDMAEGVGPRP
eukprot:gene9793-7682_t